MEEENGTQTGIEDFGLENQLEKEEHQRQVTRREFLIASGVAIAGVVVGGFVGYGIGSDQVQVVQPTYAPYTDIWVGRELDQCTGCKRCEIACSQAHEGKNWPAASRIRVQQFPPCTEFPVACYQCGDDAECMQACEMNALSLNPDNSTIEVDTSKCLRTSEGMDCLACSEACPGSTIRYHPVTRQPLFCDLCGGDPACAKACPSHAIVVRGTHIAAASPEEIAQTISHMYDLPTSYKKE